MRRECAEEEARSNQAGGWRPGEPSQLPWRPLWTCTPAPGVGTGVRVVAARPLWSSPWPQTRSAKLRIRNKTLDAKSLSAAEGGLCPVCALHTHHRHSHPYVFICHPHMFIHRRLLGKRSLRPASKSTLARARPWRQLWRAPPRPSPRRCALPRLRQRLSSSHPAALSPSSPASLPLPLLHPPLPGQLIPSRTPRGRGGGASSRALSRSWRS